MFYINPTDKVNLQQYHIILLGGLSGRLDQTVHTLSYLHKLRKTRERVFVVTDENIGWVLDSVSPFFAVYDSRCLSVYTFSGRT
jgi:thiamine pyrophosphokinase